jgi:hypothetical protein
MVAGRGVEVVVAGGFLVVIGFDMGALSAMAGRVGDPDKAPAVGLEARPLNQAGEAAALRPGRRPSATGRTTILSDKKCAVPRWIGTRRMGWSPTG